jgi:DNA-binding HxlR family transcriptional regulator
MATPRHQPRRSAPAARAAGPLDAALRRVGDRWSLLVVESLLVGPRRFGELLDGLDGLAPNILSRRLKALESDGLVVAAPYSTRPYRVAYSLTAQGAELAGALRLLTQWGAQHEHGGTPFHHATCGTAVEARWWCPTCAREVREDESPDLDYV